MILMARWMFGCVCLGREQSVICHSRIVLFLIPPVIVKCSGEFLMEFGINWHPPILQPGPGRRGRGRDADMEMETIYSLRGLAGWLSVTWLCVFWWHRRSVLSQALCHHWFPGTVCPVSKQSLSFVTLCSWSQYSIIVVPLWAVH